MANKDIFILPDDEELSIEKLQNFIDENAMRTESIYDSLWNAYNNDYPILFDAAKPAHKPDHRLVVNFAKYIADTYEGYFLGNPVQINSTSESTRDYLRRLDMYNSQDDQNAELSLLTSIFGHAYEIYYVDENSEVCTANVSPRGSFAIYNDGIKPKMRYFVRTYVDADGVLQGSVSDSEKVQYFNDSSGELAFYGDVSYHNFGDVPATEFVQNVARMGIYESVLPLINEFNSALSEKANDVDYFSDAYLKVLGAEIDSSTMNFIRDNRVINFPGTNGRDVVVDFMAKPSGDSAQEHILDRLYSLIFTIAMVINPADNDFRTSSGIALRYKLLPMSNQAKVKERSFVKGLHRRYRLIFSNPTSDVAADEWFDLTYKFTFNLPQDLLNEAQVAKELDGVVSKSTQLSVLSAVKNVDDEIARIAEDNGGSKK